MSVLSTEQLVDLRLLLSVEGIGPGRVRKLLAKFKSVDKIISADLLSLSEVEGISQNLAKKIVVANRRRSEVEEIVEKEQEDLEKYSAKIITIWDKEYPPLLKKIFDPPLFFYKRGTIKSTDAYSIAMIGTRGPTNYGKVNADRLAGELASEGITVVSGLARGIDTISHIGALKRGGRTIAVIGSGLDVVYPSENRKLYEEISETGLLISEFPFGTKPDAMNFPQRNRIISGLSLGVVVIESGRGGGSMQTVSYALDQGREVFALPGNVGVRQSEGTNLLIQKGEAKLVASAEDIIIELEVKLRPVLGKNIPREQVTMGLFEEKIFNCIGDGTAHIDKISADAGLSTSDCLVHLLSLEFKGLVKQLPGKIFAKL